MPDQNDPKASQGVQLSSKLTFGSIALKSSDVFDATTRPWSVHAGCRERRGGREADDGVVGAERRARVVDVKLAVEIADVRGPEAPGVRPERGRDPCGNARQHVARVLPGQDVRGAPDRERASRGEEVVTRTVPNHRGVVNPDVEVRLRRRGRSAAENAAAAAAARVSHGGGDAAVETDRRAVVTGTAPEGRVRGARRQRDRYGCVGRASRIRAPTRRRRVVLCGRIRGRPSTAQSRSADAAHDTHHAHDGTDPPWRPGSTLPRRPGREERAGSSRGHPVQVTDPAIDGSPIDRQHDELAG